MRGRDNIEQSLLAGRANDFMSPSRTNLIRLLLFPLRMIFRRRLDPIERKNHLKVHRLLAP